MDRVPQNNLGGVGRKAIGLSTLGVVPLKPADKEVTLNRVPNEGAKR